MKICLTTEPGGIRAMAGLVMLVWRDRRICGGSALVLLGGGGVLASVWLLGIVGSAGDFSSVVAPLIPLGVAMLVANSINVVLGVGALSGGALALPAGGWALAAAVAIAVASAVGLNIESVAALPGAAALGAAGIGAAILSGVLKTPVVAWIAVATAAALYAAAGGLLIGDAVAAWLQKPK